MRDMASIGFDDGDVSPETFYLYYGEFVCAGACIEKSKSDVAWEDGKG